MSRLRHAARFVAPVLVAVLMSFVVLGGAVHLAKSVYGSSATDNTEVSDSEMSGLVKAGLGLCAASVAVAASRLNVRRAARPLRTTLLVLIAAYRTPDPQVVATPSLTARSPATSLARLRELQSFRL